MVRKALLIEDDPDIQGLIASNIGDVGLSLDAERDGEVGLKRALANDYAILLVDLNLPAMGGMEICRQVRLAKPDLPIMILSSRASEIDKVSGLQLGADDYMTKPFGIRELLARISALLRRTERLPAAPAQTSSDSIDFGELQINLLSRQVIWKGQPIDLTLTEFDLFVFLARSPGRVFSRTELIEGVLGYHGDGYERAINPHLSRLRKKLEQAAPNAKFFRSSWGVGYAFVFGLPESSDSASD